MFSNLVFIYGLFVYNYFSIYCQAFSAFVLDQYFLKIIKL